MDNEQLKKLVFDLIDKRLEEMGRNRIYASDLPYKVVKRRSIEDKVIVFGLVADLPTDSSKGVFAYFATDTSTLYLHNGTAWVSEVFT